MSNIKEFEKLFPLEGDLTQENIDKADKSNSGKCAGALTLRAALGDNIKFLAQPNNLWNVKEGWNYVDDSLVLITTKEKIDFVDETIPQKVTFILK